MQEHYIQKPRDVSDELKDRVYVAADNVGLLTSATADSKAYLKAVENALKNKRQKIKTVMFFRR
jgi:uncharacterized protein with FMN-binding domain